MTTLAQDELFDIVDGFNFVPFDSLREFQEEQSKSGGHTFRVDAKNASPLLFGPFGKLIVANRNCTVSATKGTVHGDVDDIFAVTNVFARERLDAIRGFFVGVEHLRLAGHGAIALFNVLFDLVEIICAEVVQNQVVLAGNSDWCIDDGDIIVCFYPELGNVTYGVGKYLKISHFYHPPKVLLYFSAKIQNQYSYYAIYSVICQNIDE